MWSAMIRFGSISKSVNGLVCAGRVEALWREYQDLVKTPIHQSEDRII